MVAIFSSLNLGKTIIFVNRCARRLKVTDINTHLKSVEYLQCEAEVREPNVRSDIA